MGAPAEVIAAARELKQLDEKPFEVWPENWETVIMFSRLSTQWNINYSTVIGLNYPAVFEMMRFYKVEDQEEVFEGIRIMELAALKVLNRKKE